MRDFLDAILSFIGASSLTDDEFASITLSTQEYSVEVYGALLEILDDRESVSGVQDRLKYYFFARGVEVEDPVVGKSNINVGSVLCE